MNSESQVKPLIISSTSSRYRLLVCLFIVCCFTVFLLSNLVQPRQFYSPIIVKTNLTSLSNKNSSDHQEGGCRAVRRSGQYKVEIDGVTYPQYIPNYLNKSIDFDCLNNKKSSSSDKVKIILLWNKFFQSDDYGFGLGVREPFVRNKCPVTNCELTNSRNRSNEADLVIVHMRNAVTTPPASRPGNQRWVFMLYESPVHSGSFHTYDRFFNLTATYRVETDFANLYEKEVQYEWRLNETFDQEHDFHADKSDNKNKLAAGVISNCDASSKRLDYIKAMQQVGKVDVYGGCGTRCPSKYRNGQSGGCKHIIASEYMFYLAFENSFCQDYVTEKFFDILNYNIVPVVMGGGNYSYFVPKSGFININDYKSPKELTEYLLYLSQNKTAYNSYFKWKRHISFREDRTRAGFTPFCSMCIQLHLEDHYGIQHKILDKIGTYWDKAVNCKNPKIEPGRFQF